MISRRNFLKGGVAAVAVSAIAISTGSKAEALGITKDLPRPFLNEKELKDWLEPYGIHRGQECEDAALDLFWEAFNDGYLVWPVPVYNGRLMGEKVIPLAESGKRHFGSWAWAGNYLYYVDLRLKAPHYVRLTKMGLEY